VRIHGASKILARSALQLFDGGQRRALATAQGFVQQLTSKLLFALLCIVLLLSDQPSDFAPASLRVFLAAQAWRSACV
jgi:hypothetical protein